MKSILTEAMEKFHKKILYYDSKLNDYAEYILEMLKIEGIPATPKDLVYVTVEQENGFSKAIIYPRESVVDGKGVVNPLYFYGYEIDFKEATITFSENPKDIGAVKE